MYVSTVLFKINTCVETNLSPKTSLVSKNDTENHIEENTAEIYDEKLNADTTKISVTIATKSGLQTNEEFVDQPPIYTEEMATTNINSNIGYSNTLPRQTAAASKNSSSRRSSSNDECSTV